MSLVLKDVTVNNVESLLDALAQQPVSVAIEADSLFFQLYSGGVMMFWCGINLDHGVLALDYGTHGSSDYWKVKDSWSSSWRESVFFRLERSKGGADEYGILSYPVIALAIHCRMLPRCEVRKNNV